MGCLNIEVSPCLDEDRVAADATTCICVARHGETDWNAAGTLQGWIDIPINDKGRQQARHLAGHFADLGIQRIFSSPLIRARETAAIVAASLGLPLPCLHEGLKERCFGVIQGVPRDEIAELNPVLFQQLMKRSPACHFAQGEAMDQFAERVLEALTDIARDNPGLRVLAITHGWVLDVIVRHVNGLPRHAILPLKRKNIDHLWLEVGGSSIRRWQADAA